MKYFVPGNFLLLPFMMSLWCYRMEAYYYPFNYVCKRYKKEGNRKMQTSYFPFTPLKANVL